MFSSAALVCVGSRSQAMTVISQEVSCLEIGAIHPWWRHQKDEQAPLLPRTAHAVYPPVRVSCCERSEIDALAIICAGYLLVLLSNGIT